MVETSLIIIGAGPGGYETAVAAAHEGIDTVLVEAAELGGTCLNEGCIPTKCFCRNAEVLETIREAATYGVYTSELQFSFAEVVARKNAVVEQLKEGVKTLLHSPHITIVNGIAQFVGPHAIKVGDTVYTAPHIIIATGSEAKSLPIPGADNKGVVTARELLNVEELPKHLCIIGGGVIGLEFASVFHTFGSEVTVVEYAKEVLPTFDRDLAKRLRTSLKRGGIVFHTGAAVTSIEAGEGVNFVHYEINGKEERVEADWVLMSVGRSPRLQPLDLESAGIRFSQRGIEVDENMQTNVEGVYAIGDVNGICPLAHAATAQGLCALAHIQGNDNSPKLSLVPAAVFTVPEVASVGLTEENAKAAGIVFTVRKSFYRANGKSLAMGNSDGLLKILVDDSQHIIGAHILGAHASDLIHEIALAMHGQLTIDALAKLVHAHPSLSELVLSAARMS